MSFNYKLKSDDDDDNDVDGLQDVVLCQLIDPSEDEGELSNSLQRLFVSVLQVHKNIKDRCNKSLIAFKAV